MNAAPLPPDWWQRQLINVTPRLVPEPPPRRSEEARRALTAARAVRWQARRRAARAATLRDPDWWTVLGPMLG